MICLKNLHETILIKIFCKPPTCPSSYCVAVFLCQRRLGLSLHTWPHSYGPCPQAPGRSALSRVAARPGHPSIGMTPPSLRPGIGRVGVSCHIAYHYIPNEKFDLLADILQTTFPNALQTASCVFLFKLHSKMPLKVPLTKSHHWCRQWSNSTIKMVIIWGHNFAHAMTAQLSWDVQNCDLTGLLDVRLQKNISHKISIMFSYTVI